MSLDTSTRPDSGASNNADVSSASGAGSSTSSGTPAGGRVQLALNVRDVDAAVEFYGKLFPAGQCALAPGDDVAQSANAYAVAFFIDEEPSPVLLGRRPVGVVGHAG